MKTISLADEGDLKAPELIKTILERPGPNGFTMSEVMARARVIETLNACKDQSLELEDADHEVLKRATQEFRFGVATPQLAAILTRITGAQA